MSAISLINSGVAWFVAAAVLAFLFSFQKALSGWIAGIGGAVGSLYTAAAGFTVLTGAVGVSGALSLVSYDVQISPLNAIWLITLGLCVCQPTKALHLVDNTDIAGIANVSVS